MRTRQADGAPGCRALIDDLLAGKIDANFFEGMGCVGGCVGGPKRIIPREEGSATWTPTAATRPAPRRSTTPM
ncbi:MAG: [Fe-Fe] hydrogenase large subunit C-terminal domain-containing protein [Anaerotruncus massiliensis (ex Togo et al. 2019)]